MLIIIFLTVFFFFYLFASGERTEAMQRDAGYVASQSTNQYHGCNLFIFFIGLLMCQLKYFLRFK